MKNTGFIDEQSHGVFIISTTPFSKDGSIDFDSVDSLVEFYIEKRVSGMTILGMMGKPTNSPKMNQKILSSMLLKELTTGFLL